MLRVPIHATANTSTSLLSTVFKKCSVDSFKFRLMYLEPMFNTSITKPAKKVLVFKFCRKLCMDVNTGELNKFVAGAFNENGDSGTLNKFLKDLIGGIKGAAAIVGAPPLILVELEELEGLDAGDTPRPVLRRDLECLDLDLILTAAVGIQDTGYRIQDTAVTN